MRAPKEIQTDYQLTCLSIGELHLQHRKITQKLDELYAREIALQQEYAQAQQAEAAQPQSAPDPAPTNHVSSNVQH